MDEKEEKLKKVLDGKETVVQVRSLFEIFYIIAKIRDGLEKNGIRIPFEVGNGISFAGEKTLKLLPRQIVKELVDTGFFPEKVWLVYDDK